MKFFTESLAISFFSFCVPAALFSQAVINNTGSTSAGNYSSSTLEKQSDKLFDVETDMFDPGEGTLRWKGKIFNIEDTKIVRERFERYLAGALPEGNAEDYKRILKDVAALIEQENVSKNNINKNMIAAMKLLMRAAEFEVDGRQSIPLVKQIYKACRQRGELNDLRAWQDALSEERERLERLLNNRARNRENEERSLNKPRGKNKTVAGVKLPPSKEELHFTELLAENRAMMASASSKNSEMGLQAKLEFQSTMVGYLVARRYDHALLASAFYRVLFLGSQHGVRVGEREISELFPISNFVPSLETFDQIAREMQEETRKSMKSADALWDAKQKYHALRQLLSGFFTGENEVRVAYYSVERRREFLDLWIRMRELQRQAENKDIGVIEETLAEIRRAAPDFPDSEIAGKVRAAKLASNMAILSARQTLLLAGAEGTPSALANAMSESQNYIKKAAELWPQNPEIPRFMEDMTGRTNVMAQLAPEFDKLCAADKKREIFNRRQEFTAALMQDAARRERFEKIVSHVASLEATLAQIKMLLARKDDFIAWDMLLAAEEFDPNDEEVVLTKARTAVRVPEYSRLLSTAAQDEEKGNLGVALNVYLAAQDINPASEICRNAISRVSEKLLARIAPGKNASPETAKKISAPQSETSGAKNSATSENADDDDDFNF